MENSPFSIYQDELPIELLNFAIQSQAYG